MYACVTCIFYTSLLPRLQWFNDKLHMDQKHMNTPHIYTLCKHKRQCWGHHIRLYLGFWFTDLVLIWLSVNACLIYCVWFSCGVYVTLIFYPLKTICHDFIPWTNNSNYSITLCKKVFRTTQMALSFISTLAPLM